MLMYLDMGPTEALSLAFRVVLAVGAAPRPTDPLRQPNHRQVGSSPTIWWPARTAGIALSGGATCNFKLAASALMMRTAIIQVTKGGEEGEPGAPNDRPAAGAYREIIGK